MADTDIQYIGNWSSRQMVSKSSSFVSAVILTATEDNLKSSLTFSRGQSSVVFIGRSTCGGNESRENEYRATYTNPLMSRNHAKMIFLDSGSVSLIDHSHHGTWVNRKAEDIKLTPNKPFHLEDGDEITFGKGVMKDGFMHEPLVVSIKLLYNPSTPLGSFSFGRPEEITPPTRTRNRFCLSSSSESEPSSDSEEGSRDVKTNRVGTSLSSLFGLDSPQSNPESLTLPPVRDPLPPINPGVEDEIQYQSNNGDALHNVPKISVPPWRRISSPWFGATAGFFRQVPDILPRPSLRTDYLFGSRTSKSDASQQDSSSSHSYPLSEPLVDGHTPGPLPHDHQHRQPSVNNTDHSSGEENNFNDDIRVLKEELQSLKATLSRVDQSHITTERVQSLLDSLESRVPDLSLKAAEGHMSSFKSSFESPLKSLEETISGLKRTIPKFESYMDLSNEKFDALQKDTVTTGYLQESLDRMDHHYQSLSSKWDMDHLAIIDFKVRIESINNDLEFLRGGLADLLQDKDGHEKMDVSEDALESRLKDYIHTEIARLVGTESNPVLGKRKRTDEEHVDVHVQTVEDAPQVMVTLPPTKRLRTLKHYVVPGIIGALGTWVGLAYL